MDGVLSQEEISALLAKDRDLRIKVQTAALESCQTATKMQSVKLPISVWERQRRHCLRW